MNFNIAVLPGDGIGPEISRQGVNVMNEVCKIAGYKVEFASGLVGAAAMDAGKVPFPEETEKLCLDSDTILFSADVDYRCNVYGVLEISLVSCLYFPFLRYIFKKSLLMLFLKRFWGGVICPYQEQRVF